jgi:hypothetical protein
MNDERPNSDDVIEGSGVLGDRRKLRDVLALTRAHRLLDKWTDIVSRFSGMKNSRLYTSSLNALEQNDNFAECLGLLQDWSMWWNDKFDSVAQDTDHFIDEWTH